jgi:hypothetical protein
MPLLPFGKSGLQKAIDGFLAGGDLGEGLESIPDYVVRSKRDAEAVVRALERFPRVAKQPAERYTTSPLHHLVAFFQEAEGDAVDVFRERGIPELARIFDASFPPEDGDDDDLPFLLKILVMYAAPAALSAVVRSARHPRTADQYLWSVVFQIMQEGHPHAEEIIAQLSSPLPAGFAGVAFLDFANGLAINGRAARHPFNSAEGIARLEQYLTDTDPDKYSYAHSATAAIPFIDAGSRALLLSLAARHPDDSVQLESFWAAAKLGDESGVQALAQASLDPRRGTTPLRYLEELGRLDAAPRETKSDEFMALSEMAEWLAHPNEMGRAPDRIRVLDTREMFWPPTNDRRRLWLIAYSYDDGEAGVGMVGSVTFALFGDANPDASPEDIYGLHCAWELEMNHDPRAPDPRTSAAGRKILGI